MTCLESDCEVACECGSTNLHFGAMTVSVAPHDDYEVHRFEFKRGFERGAGEVAPVKPGPAVESRYRGGGFEVEFWCENCGRAWVEKFSFHKGSIQHSSESLSKEEARKMWEAR